ncbi:MAG: NUDIX domain-containing protein [Meiothermus sp.]|nr:NUDIX domain-containing protein [Meiothermus sp.]
MRRHVLVLPLDRPQHRILLGFKKTGFGAGRYGGFGGKLQAGETLVVAAVRELREESGLLARPQNLWYAAQLEFLFPACPDWNRTLHVFRLEFWEGEPQESREVRPQWFGFDQLPFKQMWADAPYWLPQVLLGSRPRMRFTYRTDNQSVELAEELE